MAASSSSSSRVQQLGSIPNTQEGVKYSPLELDLEAGDRRTQTSLRGKEHPDNLNYRSVFELGQVTIRVPAPPLMAIAEGFGFIPWIVPGTLMILMLTTRRAVYIYACVSGSTHTNFFPTRNQQRIAGSIPASGVSRGIFFDCLLPQTVLLITSFLNEGLFKRLFNQPRPPQSACEGPGMPSGHCITSGVLCTWFLLESATLFLTNGGIGTTGNLQQLLIRILITLLLFGPVPWARWYNLDHTFQQVLVGSLCGLFLGCLAFAFRVEYLPNMQFVWTTSTELTTATTTPFPSPIITV
ncbi:hypothetical protein FOZ63_025810 [Perkinsus olseni]|uniref:Phosphatidic acid phosphatase type 2/haloperoxidase domain-containing protein n=1 Tax=Perkinsus olseni TaxID=32597 RepID=A0A7J6NDY3_PEROL|nr:hypothetical protein FOZ63_025810 [Perkinsus olseni]